MQPVSGEFYQDKEGNLYQIIGLAKQFDTKEDMVIYQALYGTYLWYVKPLSEFVSCIDKEHDSNTTQTYCLKQVFPKTGNMAERQTEQANTMQNPTLEKTEEPIKRESKPWNSGFVSENADEPTKAENKEQVREDILRFLDAEDEIQKLEVLRSLRNKLDESFITTVELSMDLLPDERESLERRYELIEQNLLKRIRFEGGRLR